MMRALIRLVGVLPGDVTPIPPARRVARPVERLEEQA